MTTSSVFCFRESGQVLWNNEIKNTYSTDRQNSTLKSEHASSGAKTRTPRSKCLQLELEIWLECTSHTVLWGDTQDCAASRSCRHWHSWSTDNIQSSKTFQISLYYFTQPKPSCGSLPHSWDSPNNDPKDLGHFFPFSLLSLIYWILSSGFYLLIFR